MSCSRLDCMWDENLAHGSLFTLPTGLEFLMFRVHTFVSLYCPLSRSRLDCMWHENSAHGSLFTLPTGAHHRAIRRAVAPAFSTDNLK